MPDFSIPGDADDDGEVLPDDAMAMLKYLAGPPIEISDPAADVKGDETVDVKDILLILHYFAGRPVKLK